MNPVLLGNGIATVGALLMVSTGFIKQRRNILIVQSAQFGVLGISNLILGGITGAVSNLLGILRNIYCLKCPLSSLLGWILLAVQGVLTFALNSMGLIGWLPLVATAVLTFTINSKDEVVLKAAIILGQLCWMVYDLTIHNYVGLAFDVFTVFSNLIGIGMICAARKKTK